MPIDFRAVFQRALPYAQFLERHATAENRLRWQQVYDATIITPEQADLMGSFRRKMNVLCMSGPWCGDCVNACPIFQRFAEHSLLIDLRFVNRDRDFDTASKAALAFNTAGASATKVTGPKPGTPDDPDDIRSRPIGKILVKWGILTPERVEKALLVQEEQKAKGLNARIGDVLTEMGMITSDQRDQALAAQGGYQNFAAWDVAVAKELSICGAPRVPVLLFLSEDWFECERFGERTLTTYREKARKTFANLQSVSCPTGLLVPEKEMHRAIVAEWLGHFERIQWMLLTSPRLMKVHGEV
jgi:thiol-disulfide isomerase/thioredoxin